EEPGRDDFHHRPWQGLVQGRATPKGPNSELIMRAADSAGGIWRSSNNLDDWIRLPRGCTSRAHPRAPSGGDAMVALASVVRQLNREFDHDRIDAFAQNAGAFAPGQPLDVHVLSGVSPTLCRAFQGYLDSLP